MRLEFVATVLNAAEHELRQRIEGLTDGASELLTKAADHIADATLCLQQAQAELDRLS